MRRFSRPLRRSFAAACAMLTVLACSDDNGVSPNPDIAFMVGDWEAVTFTIVPEGGGEGLDLIAEGGAFTLNVQPSGQYTAILTIPGVPPPPPELGMLSVEGDELLFHRTTPPQVTSRTTYERLGDGHVQFSGPSQVDLDGNGTPEIITLDVEIVRD